MKTVLKPYFRNIIFLLFGFVQLSGCSNLPMDQAVQTAIVQTKIAQPFAAVVIPTKTLLPRNDITATIEPPYSPTPTFSVTPTQYLGTPIAETDLLESSIINEKYLRKFIPELNDLPNLARYRICNGCEDIVTNQEIIWSWGKAKADRYIDETGRINGWSIQYERGSLEVYAPEVLTLSVQIYNNSAGASLMIKNFNAMQVFPEQGWVQEQCRVDLIRDCIYLKKTRLDHGGHEIVISRLYFSYHNLVGVVTGEGWPEDVVPEILEATAHKMYQKMSASPLTTSVALTPTP
jgi:hypothetical protein